MYAIGDVNLNLIIFQCEVCRKLLNDPIQLSPCGHRVCKACLPEAQSQICPVCGKEPTCVPPNFNDSGFKMDMQTLMATCEQCNAFLTLADHRQHQEGCKKGEGEFNVNMISAKFDGSRFACPTCYSCFTSYPVQFQCGHRFCIPCCNEYRNCNICPYCRAEIKLEESFYDLGIMNDLKISELSCSNKNCQWAGRYDDFKIHQKECQFKICGACNMLHIPNVVYNCRTKCEKCKSMILAEQYEEHFESCDEYAEVPYYYC